MQLMEVAIESLEFETILGILDFERTTPQKVVVDLKFSYQFGGDFIDYSVVAESIKTMMNENKYRLIEDAILDISSNLRTKYPAIETIFLKITKPSILPDCRVSVSLKS